MDTSTVSHVRTKFSDISALQLIGSYLQFKVESISFNKDWVLLQNDALSLNDQ
jgi:hypothetical protein